MDKIYVTQDQAPDLGGFESSQPLLVIVKLLGLLLDGSLDSRKTTSIGFNTLESLVDPFYPVASYGESTSHRIELLSNVF